VNYVPGSEDVVALLEHTSDGVLLLGADGVVQYANAQAQRLFRQRSDALVGLAYWALAEDAQTAESSETLSRAHTRGLAGRFEIFLPKLYAWHAVTVAPRDDGGVIMLIRDVTDRMRLLRDEAVRRGIQEVVEKAPIAISITRGAEHRFDIVNEAALELLGGRDVVGMTLQNAFPELVDQGFLELLDSVYQSGVPHHAREVPVQFRRGAEKELVQGIFDITYQPLRDANGMVSGILSVSVDVRELVLARREMAKFIAARS
jgi:PAS domain S-box-containing protein